MNIKKNSIWMLSLVFGVSVILYILDVPIIPTSNNLVPTVFIPQSNTSVPTESFTQSFTETINYDPEGRFETIKVTVKLQNGIITELVSQHSMNDGKSRRYQMAFEAEIQPLVIGKDIRSLNVTRVAGASATTNAFMQAIESIRSRI